MTKYGSEVSTWRVQNFLMEFIKKDTILNLKKWIC